MKVALITPWPNAWVPYFKRSIEARGHEFVLGKDWLDIKGADVVIHGWADGRVAPYPGARNIMFLRRYELFDGNALKVEWKNVDALICVNTWIATRIKEYFAAKNIAVPVHVIYNGTDLDRWTFKVRKPNHRLGMACHVHPKKNLPLALQILALLPEWYELHVAGAVQDSCTAEYLHHVGKRIRRKVYLYDHVPHEQMDLWWEQMGYCLSTSLSEGNPNNVIEAMAKGIRPVVHCWPGAEDQFLTANLFHTAEEAARMIASEDYDSDSYRAQVEHKFSLSNIDQAVELSLQTKPEKTNESVGYG